MDRQIRNRAGLALVLCVCLVAGSAHARAPAHLENGCHALADIVQDSVGRALGGPLLPAWTAAPGELQRCSRVAVTASRAFTLAWQQQGVTLRWQVGPGIDPGDYCLSHYIDQCYPRVDPAPWRPVTAGAVSTAWSAVRAVLRLDMPFGSASDFAWFEPARLATVLDLALGPRRGAPRR